MKYTPKIGDLVEWRSEDRDILDQRVIETWWGVVVGEITTPPWSEIRDDVWLHVFWMDTKTIEAEVASNLQPIQKRK